MAAGLSMAFMPMTGHRNMAVRAFKGAVIKGAITKMTGGKFANGAISGAIQAAMAGGQSESAENDVVYGEPEASTIHNIVIHNSELAKYVTVDSVTGAMTLQVPYAVAPGTDPTLVASSESEVEGSLSGTFTKGVLRWKREITLSVDLVQGGQNPAFIFAACSPARCNSSSGIQGADIGPITRIEISPTARSGSRMHESLHFAGLGHQWNRTSSIMSYSASRRVKFSDVERLYGAYP